MAKDYKTALLKDSSQVSPSGPITKNEILAFRKKLEQKDPLKDLYEGLKPGGSTLTEEDPDM
jgi:hypothetical protein